MQELYKFPSRLKELMEECNISQNKLSKETGIAQSQIARWLKNETRPNIDFLMTLAQFFKCSIDYLVGLEDWKSTENRLQNQSKNKTDSRKKNAPQNQKPKNSAIFFDVIDKRLPIFFEIDAIKISLFAVRNNKFNQIFVCKCDHNFINLFNGKNKFFWKRLRDFLRRNKICPLLLTFFTQICHNHFFFFCHYCSKNCIFFLIFSIFLRIF